MLKLIDKIAEAAAAVSLLLSLAMICANVIYRYLISAWMQRGGYFGAGFLQDTFATIAAIAGEVPGYLLIWIAFFGAYLVQRRRGHICFDMLFNMLPQRIRTVLGYAIDFSLFGLFAVLLVQSVRMILVDGATEIETVELAQGWFMLVLPISSVLLAVAIVVRKRE